MNLHLPLASLAARRPVFHSEADFQHELAWELRALGVARSIRIERPVDVGGRRMNLDLLVDDDAGSVAIELKHWSKGCTATHAGETFTLRNQGGQDLSRYDFWHDVARLERVVGAGLANRGCAVALTNDPSFWGLPTRETIDAAFRLHAGRTITGALAWSPTAGHGTTKGRPGVTLQGRYTADWQRYSVVEGAGEFKVLVVRVG